MRQLTFSPKQKQVLTWWCKQGSRYEGILCDGAVRSGKTLCLSLSFFCWAMTQFRSQQFALCGKTIGALRRNLLAELLPLLTELGFSIQEKRSENLLLIRYQDRENRFFLFGGRDASSADLIQGITLAGVLFDEVVLMPQAFVEQACARCSVPNSKLWFNCNPASPHHWFYQEWIRKSEERHILYLHFTMADNPSLTPKIRSRFERSYSGVFYQRFILGLWVASSGLVYPFFQPELFCKPPPSLPCQQYCLSIDYGTTNPTSCGLWGLHQSVWYRLDEYYYDSRQEGQQKTDAEYVADLLAFSKGYPISAVIVDPSAASFLQALRRAGFPVVKADNQVVNGIRITADALKSGRLIICPSCRNCIRELGLYAWDTRRQDVPLKENDHAMDELRYFAVFSQKQQRSQPFFAGSVERST